MADPSWRSLFGLAFGGGFTVKFLDIRYQEYRAWKTRHTEDTKTIDERLEPLLRADDELVGSFVSCRAELYPDQGCRHRIHE